MKTITVSGKSVEEAVQQGLSQLGVAQDRVHIHVLEQPSKGLFGLLGSKEAKVELVLKTDAVEVAESFVKEICHTMGLDIELTRKENQEGVVLDISGDGDLGILIGRRGQTLDALQYLVNIAANRNLDQRTRITLDAENFRERRRKTLEELTLRLADKAIRTRREVVLEPMSAHERKIIHTCLQDHPKVKSYSKGEEPNRRVVIGLIS